MDVMDALYKRALAGCVLNSGSGATEGTGITSACDHSLPLSSLRASHFAECWADGSHTSESDPRTIITTCKLVMSVLSMQVLCEEY